MAYRMAYLNRLLGGAALLAVVISGTDARAQSSILITLLSFATSNGAYPFGGLVYGSSGSLYGATFGGGKYGYGDVYSLTPAAAGGWTKSILFHFSDPDSTGSNPYGTLMADSSGALYGTTAHGGTYGLGTAFTLSTGGQGGAWVETVLYSFGSTEDDGINPYGGLVMDAQGVLYGTTVSGGTAGSGTVYSLTQTGGAWVESVLYNFTGGSEDAANPYAGLTLGPDGTLYGTAPYGGPSSSGAVYALTPQTGGGWAESVLCAFPGGSGGANPYGGVMIGSDGGLYGSTTNGGKTSGGTVYECSQPQPGQWISTVLYNPPSSAVSYGVLVSDTSGALYGTTAGAHGNAANDGTVFKLTPPATAGQLWTESTLHAFPGLPGNGPRSGVIWGPNGALYGTTVGIGARNVGSVFQLSF
jgi:uncharacterized repeat protein (TIGR03803 family)